MALDKAALLAAIGPLPREEVAIPGGTVLVQGLSATAKDEYEEACIVLDGEKRKLNFRDMRAKLLVRCVVNPDGSRMFSDEEMGLVGGWPTVLVDQLTSVAERLSAVTPADLKALKKNAETMSAAASSSGSPTSGDSPTPTS